MYLIPSVVVFSVGKIVHGSLDLSNGKTSHPFPSSREVCVKEETKRRETDWLSSLWTNFPLTFPPTCSPLFVTWTLCVQFPLLITLWHHPWTRTVISPQSVTSTSDQLQLPTSFSTSFSTSFPASFLFCQNRWLQQKEKFSDFSPILRTFFSDEIKDWINSWESSGKLKFLI